MCQQRKPVKLPKAHWNTSAPCNYHTIPQHWIHIFLNMQAMCYSEFAKITLNKNTFLYSKILFIYISCPSTLYLYFINASEAACKSKFPPNSFGVSSFATKFCNSALVGISTFLANSLVIMGRINLHTAPNQLGGFTIKKSLTLHGKRPCIVSKKFLA